jgi:hypothetical protein
MKCPTCDGYQGKWFFLNLGVPTLGLLVALISVVSLSVALMSPLRTPKSEVGVSFQFFEDGVAHLVASNPGTRPGTIGEAWFDLAIPGVERERRYLKEQTGNRFIAPGASRELAFAIPCEKSAPSIQYQRSEGFGAHPIVRTELTISIVQFDGRTDYRKFGLDELPGIGAFNDALHDCIQNKLRAAATLKAD